MFEPIEREVENKKECTAVGETALGARGALYHRPKVNMVHQQRVGRPDIRLWAAWLIMYVCL